MNRTRILARQRAPRPSQEREHPARSATLRGRWFFDNAFGAALVCMPPHSTSALDAARATLDAALREEGEALASACEAVKASGAGSADAARALRSAEAAHARSHAATGEVRALNAQADPVTAEAEPAAPSPGARAI